MSLPNLSFQNATVAGLITFSKQALFDWQGREQLVELKLCYNNMHITDPGAKEEWSSMRASGIVQTLHLAQRIIYQLYLNEDSINSLLLQIHKDLDVIMAFSAFLFPLTSKQEIAATNHWAHFVQNNRQQQMELVEQVVGVQVGTGQRGFKAAWSGNKTIAQT